LLSYILREEAVSRAMYSSARHLADCCEFLFLRKGVEALKVILSERDNSASDICRFTISVFAKRGAHVVFVDAKEAI
jgi:tryptophanase